MFQEEQDENINCGGKHIESQPCSVAPIEVINMFVLCHCMKWPPCSQCTLRNLQQIIP